MMETGKLDPRSNRGNQGAFLAMSQTCTDGHRRAAWNCSWRNSMPAASSRRGRCAQRRWRPDPRPLMTLHLPLLRGPEDGVCKPPWVVPEEGAPPWRLGHPVPARPTGRKSRDNSQVRNPLPGTAQLWNTPACPVKPRGHILKNASHSLQPGVPSLGDPCLSWMLVRLPAPPLTAPSTSPTYFTVC